MMGTGPFALPTFRHLLASGHEVAVLVTQPPRAEQGRRSAATSPLRAEAQAHGIPLFDPPDVNDPTVTPQLAALGVELWVVADYGQILSPATLATSRLGGVNLHGSLLPRYRGAAPINWALWNGDSHTGVTVIHMTPRLDAGPMLAQARVAIGPDETAPELEARLAELGAPLVAEVIEQLASGLVRPLEQDANSACRARRLKKSDGAIDWTRPALAIKNQIRALEPWPKTFTYWLRADREPVRLILGAVRVVSAAEQPAAAAAPQSGVSAPPGTVCRAEGDQLWVATGDGRLAIDSAQPAGKRLLPAAELLRGYPLAVGDRLGPAEED